MDKSYFDEVLEGFCTKGFGNWSCGMNSLLQDGGCHTIEHQHHNLRSSSYLGKTKTETAVHFVSDSCKAEMNVWTFIGG
jgi:hypothetical protein